MSETAPEAVTAFHLVVAMLRELDERLGPEFSATIKRRVVAVRDDFRAEGSDVDADALTEGLDWLDTMIKNPSS